MLFGYDTGVISGALLYIEDDFTLSSFMQGVVVSSILVGAAVGAVSCGPLTDRLGRRGIALAAAVIFAVGAIGSALTPNVGVLVFFRVVLGLGVGLSSVVVPLYISEISPKQIRGTLTSLYQLLITVGILAAYIVDYALSWSGAWRWMLGLAVIPAVLMFVGMYFMPETPRWLVGQGRLDQARGILGRTRSEDEIEEEIGEIQDAEKQSQEEAGWRELLESWVRPALIVGVGIAALQQLIGINTIIYYAPTTLTQLGFGGSAAILGNVSIGVVNVLFTLVALWLIDRTGRKPLLLGGNVGMVLALVVLGVASLLFGASGGAIGILTLVCLAVYIAFFAATWGPTMWTMLPELYPAKIRGSGQGVATMFNWGANFIVSLTFPVLLGAIGSGPVFLIFAVIGVLAFIFVRALVPETKGRSLEEIETELRGGKNEPRSRMQEG